jgi:excisionase family DNA binding protein
MAEMLARDGDLELDAVLAALRVSKRTLERHAEEWGLAKRQRPQKGRPPVTVYDPDDVARVAADRQSAPAMHVLPAGQTGNGNGRTETPTSTHVPTRHYAGADDPSGHLAAALEAVLLRLFQSPPALPPASPPLPPVAETRYVTVKDAAAILGLPQADVRRLCHDGDLNHRLTGRGGIRIRRKDLEAL